MSNTRSYVHGDIKCAFHIAHFDSYSSPMGWTRQLLETEA